MFNNQLNKELIQSIKSRLDGNDSEFFSRIWSTDPKIYIERIQAIKFSGMDRVLDAGCGFGQWSIALASLNEKVVAIDSSKERINTLNMILDSLSIKNLSICRGSIENTPFHDESFDGIFSYSVIYFTNFRKTLVEFARLIRPRGYLYLCLNGLGWYLHNLINGHNNSESFNSTAMSLDTLQHSFLYYSSGQHVSGSQLVIPSAVIVSELDKYGFEICGIGDEGTISIMNSKRGKSFFQGQYFGVEGVYEVLARKK